MILCIVIALPNFAIVNSCPSFSLLNAIRKSNGKLITIYIAIKCKKKQQLLNVDREMKQRSNEIKTK